MSTSDSNHNDGSSNDDVCEMNNKLQKLSTKDDKKISFGLSMCANCGKEGDDVNNKCNKCKQVKYCNAACKKKHRSKHKKQCERYVAELHKKELFKQPPPLEDCPICFTRIPLLETGSYYYACCGRTICSGCIQAPVYDNQGNTVAEKKCAFCRTPFPKSVKEEVERYKVRVEAGDPIAIYNIGNSYRNGVYGFPRDYTKALELYHRAAELGSARACNDIAYAYVRGEGVEVDEKKAEHYYELAAMKGNGTARHNLGITESYEGNMDRALKHLMIAVGGGHAQSLERIKDLYSKGHITKDDYTEALLLYQAYLDEIKSPQRDKAAADDEDCRYY